MLVKCNVILLEKNKIEWRKTQLIDLIVCVLFSLFIDLNMIRFVVILWMWWSAFNKNQQQQQQQTIIKYANKFVAW